jgi:GGDEF domain-containing protein
MRSILGLRDSKPVPSPLEGFAGYRARPAESDLRMLGRREWWLWLSAILVTALSATAFLLSSLPSLFRNNRHFYEMRSDQARWATMCLLLLFNGWLVYRQWSFRRVRRQFTGQSGGPEMNPVQISGPDGMDPVTGLHTRAFIEQRLGKEMARAKRQNTPLSLAAVHLDKFDQIMKQFGQPASELALKELTRRLKRASRGADFVVRMSNDDFLLVLPECGLGDVKLVLDRLGPLEIVCDRRKVPLAYTTGWVDCQPGDLPADLLSRAAQILHLYETAAKLS